MKELGIDAPDYGELVKQAEVLTRYWNIKDHPPEDIEALYRAMA